MTDLPGKLDRISFRKEVTRSLHHLYNPAELRQSDLMRWFGLEISPEGPSKLRRIFLEAIETMKPGGSSQESKAGQLYQALHYRFSENVAQKEVANSMSKSIRQLRRIEMQAIEVLVDILWNRMPGLALDGEEHRQTAGIEDGWSGEKAGQELNQMPTTVQEIAQFDQSLPTDLVNLKILVESVAKTIQPLATQLNVELTLIFPDSLPVILGKAVSLRQGILTLLVPLCSPIPGGSLLLQADTDSEGQSVSLMIMAFPQKSNIPATSGVEDESIDFARMMIQLSGGTLGIITESLPGGNTIQIKLPAMKQIRVLAIDDNADVLQLMQRYAANTRYRLIGLKDLQNLLAVIEEHSPQLIVLDVMMAGIDGWELLGRLREHPLTRAVPIIICTILQQEQLALALGAMGFLRKPVTRKAFLEALDQQAARLESRSQ